MTLKLLPKFQTIIFIFSSLEADADSSTQHSTDSGTQHSTDSGTQHSTDSGTQYRQRHTAQYRQQHTAQYRHTVNPTTLRESDYTRHRKPHDYPKTAAEMSRSCVDISVPQTDDTSTNTHNHLWSLCRGVVVFAFGSLLIASCGIAAYSEFFIIEVPYQEWFETRRRSITNAF